MEKNFESIAELIQDPHFVQQVKEGIDNLVASLDSGGMSVETFVELNPLIKDAATELSRLAEDQDKKNAANTDIFGQAN